MIFNDEHSKKRQETYWSTTTRPTRQHQHQPVPVDQDKLTKPITISRIAAVARWRISRVASSIGTLQLLTCQHNKLWGCLRAQLVEDSSLQKGISDELRMRPILPEKRHQLLSPNYINGSRCGDVKMLSMLPASWHKHTRTAGCSWWWWPSWWWVMHWPIATVIVRPIILMSATFPVTHDVLRIRCREGREA